MKKINKGFVCLLIYFAIIIIPSYAVSSVKKIKLKSKINSVTVFSDRAQITRTATKKLEEGEYQLIFSELPESIYKESIQVSGQGNAILKDVKYSSEYLKDIPDENRKILFDEKQKLEDSL